MASTLSERWRLRVHALAWIGMGAVLGVAAHWLTGVAWAWSLLFGVPLGLAATPVSLSTAYLSRAMPLPRTPPARVVVSALAAALATAAVWAVLGRAWWLWLARYQPSMLSAPLAPLTTLIVGIGALSYLLGVTAQYLSQAFEHSAEVAQRALQSQIGQREAELRALRAQIDPHFLFNSLNSISGLIAADPAKARRMCQMLGDFLRDSLSLGGAAHIPLAREVALAEQYLRIEQVRFGERLRVETAMSAGGGTASVPALILQPLVENAVRHGIATRLDGGAIEIAVRRAGDRAIIVVSNPRDPDASRKGTGLGLDIVRRRLAAAFGDAAALSIEAAPESYKVSVSLPVEEPTS